jgi:crotonobetainyl-CoA:carnitine CoA-transferase CaiB-like acyl-CoA transferase
VTLDLEKRAGQRLLQRLASTADALIETAPVGWMDERGAGYKALSTLNPRLVYTAVTPFGQWGPRVGWRGGELTTQAMGGALHMTGEQDGRPVRGAVRVADHVSGYTAALATAVALFYQRKTGQGQYIDLSMQEAMLSNTEAASVLYWFTGMVRGRNGWRYPSTTCPAGVYPCKDGYASIVASRPHQWAALRDWIGDPRLYEERYMQEPVRFAERDYLDPIFIEWTKTMPKAVLFHEGQRRDIPIGESLRPGEVPHDAHLRQLGYTVHAEHAELGHFLMPGAPFRMTGTPWRLRRPAPLLGEHNAEVYGELGLSAEEIDALQQEGVL